MNTNKQKVEFNQTDIVLSKQDKKACFIEISVLHNSNVQTKEKEKLTKYKDLAWE